MLRELLALFGGGQPERTIASDLERMINHSVELLTAAGDAFLQRSSEPVTADQVRRSDKAINRLERRLRKEAFLEALGDSRNTSLAFCLSLVNVVKDVERIGDYAKDLVVLVEMTGPISMTSDRAHELERSVGEIERFAQELAGVMREGDQVKAVRLIERGKDIRRDVAQIQFDLLTERQTQIRAAADTLAAQYYLRVVGHVLNVLSTLVTPIHRMDYTRRKDLLPEVRNKLEASADPERS